MEAVAAIWTAVQSSQVFQAISAVATIGSAVGSIVQGQRESEMYALQAQQARTQSRVQALQHEQQANSVLRRSIEAQAAARARAAAGGIDPFSGSARLVQDISAKTGGEEFDMSLDNARLVAATGETQAEYYQRAGRSARTRGLVGAFTGLAQGAAMLGKIGGPTVKA